MGSIKLVGEQHSFTNNRSWVALEKAVHVDGWGVLGHFKL